MGVSVKRDSTVLIMMGYIETCKYPKHTQLFKPFMIIGHYLVRLKGIVL